MSPETAVSLHGVTRTYRSPGGSVEALHPVDATFRAGTVVALVGPSGSGKSTLLRILGGMDAADTGSVVVAGVDVRALRGARLRRYRRETVAFLAQRAVSNLVPHLSVREHLGRDGVALAERLGLQARLDATAGSLSGGEQARAAFAAGLARGTPVVLLDEPTAELDRAAAELVLRELCKARDAGRTLVVATHDRDLVELADTRVDLASPLRGTVAHARTRSAAAEPALAARGLTRRYAGTAVVDGATLDVRRGELAVLLGRSGSGKSTLLMLMGDWLRADEGTVVVPGHRWHETAYLAQRFGLLPELTVAENVGLPLRLAGAAADGRVGAMLERLGLGGLADRLPGETSVGQQQRTALARCLVAAPLALLADEPTSHQDAGSATLVWRALDEACAAGTACLVATHDEAATRRADRVWRIADGRIAR